MISSVYNLINKINEWMVSILEGNPSDRQLLLSNGFVDGEFVDLELADNVETHEYDLLEIVVVN